MKVLGALSLVLLFPLAGCVSGTFTNKGNDLELLSGDEDNSTDDFDVSIYQSESPMAMPSAMPGPIDVKYTITVENRTKEPVQLKRVDLQSVGSEQMRIDVSTRKFDKAVAPGQKVSVDYWATARVVDANVGVKTPLIIRTRLHLWDGNKERQESFTRRVNGYFAVGVGGA